MGVSPSMLPDQESLMLGLNSILEKNGHIGCRIVGIEREPHVYMSTYPGEIVNCQIDDGNKLRLLFKYSAEKSQDAYGHRGGIDYEAKTYGHVLQRFGVSAPKFYGAYRDPKTGWLWLVLEYMDNCLRVSKEPDSLPSAAGWVGGFHADNEGRVNLPELLWLKRYDAQYYLGWAQQTSQFAGELHKRFRWLADFCDGFDEMVAALLDSPQTVIHGEFYPDNVLVRDGGIHPVDWQSTAIAAGEIDLAALTEGWGKEAVEKCESEYLRSRWPMGTPVDFRRTLDAAKVYWHFRWLGDNPNWTLHKNSLWHFEALRSIGERWNLI